MDKVIKTWIVGHKVSKQNTSGDYDLVFGETEAGVPGPPPLFHKGYHESFVITEGEMDFIVNGELRRVRQGESVDLPPNTTHTFKNSGDKTCRWVNVHSPKGFGAFFDKYGISEEEADAKSRSVSPEIIQDLLANAAGFDMHIVAEKKTQV
ncbi:cupin domain-containing protein [Christiangramia aquimixticola]|uniref:cupin domain-containing protein n=1 Tax=Christiangramia aquimixticola TaxID=1697558 RepID=UPI003AA86E7B